MEKIIITTDRISHELQKLLQNFPELKVIEEKENFIILNGILDINVRLKNFSLKKGYLIDINIPLNNSEFPYVVDVGESINRKYPHVYSDGVLCLETEATLAYRFFEGFDLLSWVYDFVIPYYISYEYYQQYGVYPFGERSHGWKGIIESYIDIFKTNDDMSAYKIMQYISSRQYRGHMLCPCESGKKIRDCHGKYMMHYYKESNLIEILKKDLIVITKGWLNEKKRKNIK